MIDYARANAKAQQVEKRVTFQVMDALRMLEFPAGYFDLVNQRNAASFLRTWDWPKLMGEFSRVTGVEGIIRLTESDFVVETPGPATTRVFEIILEAFHQAGHLFHHDTKGITNELVRILQQYCMIADVHTRLHEITYHAGTPEWENLAAGTKLTMQTVAPFLKKWTRVPQDYEALCRQAFDELDQPDMTATIRLLTVWGKRPLG